MSALVLSAALLALAAADPAAAPLTVPPEKNPAAAAAASPALALPEALAARAGAYRTVVDALKKPGDNAPFCRALDEATALTAALEAPLAKRREEVWSDPAKLEAFTAGVDKLANELPGIALKNGAEVLYAARDDRELATRAPTLAAEELMKAAEPLTRPWPVYLEQVTDVQGCVEPDGATSAVVQLRRAWETGPRCVRERLDKELKRSLARLGEGSWFCAEEKTARKQSEKTLESLEALPAGLGGAEVAKRLRAQLASKDARFGRASAP
jgi:hypothetical protein